MFNATRPDVSKEKKGVPKMSTKSTMGFAEDFLEKNKIKKVPFDIFDLCEKNNISAIPYSYKDARHMLELIGIGDWMNKTDGVAVQVAETSAIFFDDTLPMMRQKSTVAHEIGHHVLTHFDRGIYKCECHDCGACKERQADSFALNLLFPDPKKFSYRKEYRK